MGKPLLAITSQLYEIENLRGTIKMIWKKKRLIWYTVGQKFRAAGHVDFLGGLSTAGNSELMIDVKSYLSNSFLELCSEVILPYIFLDLSLISLEFIIYYYGIKHICHDIQVSEKLFLKGGSVGDSLTPVWDLLQVQFFDPCRPAWN